ncbi:GNAT family N-acetyltransferase [Iodobacter arcticus]|uniref:GNAT family N-acetyltransferase n=1 Tax=Iodobacter arcticus TaxID=590593 RepID=A0ABW2R0A5_9NEIS
MPISDYHISTDQQRFDLDAIHAFLSQSYWSPGISRDTVAKATQNSLAFGVFLGDQQIGFARVITDRASFAYLADVYILDTHRGQGLAKYLIATIQAHPDLQMIRRFMLATKDAHSLYTQFGFTELGNPARFMEINLPAIYQS